MEFDFSSNAMWAAESELRVEVHGSRALGASRVLPTTFHRIGRLHHCEPIRIHFFFFLKGMLMKYLKCTLVIVAMLAMVATAPVASAVSVKVADYSFESGPLVDDGNGVGKWNPFAGGTDNTSDSTETMPRTGLRSLELNLASKDGFAGAYQDIAAAPGTLFDYSVWHKETTDQNGAGVEMRVEFRDSVADTEISRTANFTPASLGANWEAFTISDSIPAGADTARIVYAIQSFGADVPQQVFVDDVTFECIPEPASLALLGLGGIAIATMRRRK